ncbi:DMT family transporter [Anaerophilus nitritogenes]|uniref:DMT family transporter n=1 Tax=Anaerophilus nitritogenes TaxID=2498136 RepID=UPI00101E1921|nr:DMT family transporter [Anaerophilus nitritogenes]
MNDQMNMKGTLCAIFSALSFGTMPIFATYAYNGGVNAITVVFFRFLFSGILLGCYFLKKKINIKVGKNTFLTLLFTGIVGSSLTSLTLFLSYQYISVGLSTILHFIYPAVVIFLSFLIFKEKLYKTKIISLILSVMGVYVLIGFNSIKLNMLGVMLALVSGIFYSIYILEIGHNIKIKDIDSIILTFYISIFSSGSIFLFGIFTQNLIFPKNMYSFIPIFAITIASTLGLLNFAIGIKMIGPSNTSILSTFEPITSIILSCILFGDKITWNTIIGSCLIILSIYGIIKGSEGIEKDKHLLK